MTEFNSSRSDAIREILVELGDTLAKTEPTGSSRHARGRSAALAVRRRMNPGVGFWRPGVAVAMACVLVGLLIVGATAFLTMVRNDDDETLVVAPTVTGTPRASVKPLAFDPASLPRCLEAAGSIVLGDIGTASTPSDAWRDLALRDLSAILLSQNPEILASAYPTTSEQGGVEGITVIPASRGVSIDALFQSAHSDLVPQLQSLVDSDDLQVREAAGYAFSDLCSSYVQLLGLMMTSDERILDRLSLSRSEAKVRFRTLDPMPEEVSSLIAGREVIFEVELAGRLPDYELW